MQMTFFPFWFRMVSVAMVVLPVWRSPMMSSRCPLPMGIMESMALMPVWRGTVTDFLLIMPGAWCSMGRVSRQSMGPLPSMGLPSASTTRPISFSPTGTESTSPVRRTRLPSSTPTSEPSMTTLTQSSSRFRAMPTAPPSKRSSSLARQRSRPWTLAMPSPTWIT